MGVHVTGKWRLKAERWAAPQQHAYVSTELLIQFVTTRRCSYAGPVIHNYELAKQKKK